MVKVETYVEPPELPGRLAYVLTRIHDRDGMYISRMTSEEFRSMSSDVISVLDEMNSKENTNA